MPLFSAYFTFLRFGLLCFGGGNALISLYVDELVGDDGWMTMEEFGNLTAVAQITPGPIGINTATFMGYRCFGGTAGAAFATLGLITPSVVIMSFIAKHIGTIERNRFLGQFMRMVAPATIALMFVAAWIFAGMSAWGWDSEKWSLERTLESALTIRPVAIAICAATVWAVVRGKVKITTVILVSAAFGLVSAAFGALFRGLAG